MCVSVFVRAHAADADGGVCGGGWLGQDLNSSIRNQNADVGDIKQARLLLKSAITSNPKHAPAWIAAARLEVIAGKVNQGRNLIMQGCEATPLNEDIWCVTE